MAAHCNVMRCSAVLCSAVQCSAVQSPSGTPSGEGVYLTVYPSSCPNTDTVKCSAKWLLLCSATQCILINCDEDDFGVSVTFRTSQEIQCLPYEGIFFRDLFHETTHLLLKNKYGDLLNLSYIHIYFIC